MIPKPLGLDVARGLHACLSSHWLMPSVMVIRFMPSSATLHATMEAGQRELPCPTEKLTENFSRQFI
jgi:hypothetical protein